MMISRCGDFVECARFDVALDQFVAGDHRGPVAGGVLVEGADPGASVQQRLVTVQGSHGVGGLGLDGEKFLVRVGHGLSDGQVDPLFVTVDADR